MKLRIPGMLTVAALAVFSFAAPVFAQDAPEGVPMGDIQYGDPNAEQGYYSGQATDYGAGTDAYLNADNAAIDSDSAASGFDGSSYDSYDSYEGNIGTVVEPNQ